ncbi:hypothetical protein JKP88DRAFT_351089 [Tribonema minus]|uniref:Uncharacterized protein n=1 Tax=Tribonema minus TaxID=303371 RepID=A0A836C8C0_9STRA|nr:hypothetical protein JKP88DRAFT_351089 [Tribonema minus]
MGETLDPSSKRTDIILALVAGAAIGGFVAYTMVQTGNLTHKFDNLEKTISALSDKFDTFSKSVSDDMDTLKMQLNMLLGIGAASAFVVSSPTLSFFVKKAKEGLQAITGSDQEATDAKQKLEEKPNAKSSKQ